MYSRRGFLYWSGIGESCWNAAWMQNERCGISWSFLRIMPELPGEVAPLPLIDEEAQEEFARFARLRNLLAHEDLDLLYRRIRRFLEKAPPYYEKMLMFLEKLLQEERGEEASSTP